MPALSSRGYTQQYERPEVLEGPPDGLPRDAGKGGHTSAARTAGATSLCRVHNNRTIVDATLSREFWRLRKQRYIVNAPMARGLGAMTGAVQPIHRQPLARPERQSDEWRISNMAAKLDVLQPIVHD
jgi:hypothetical protein